MKSPIVKDCLKVNIDGHTRLKIVTIFLLQVSVRELYNSLVSDPEDGGLKEARYVKNNIIISDSALCSLLPPQQNNISKIKGHVQF